MGEPEAHHMMGDALFLAEAVHGWEAGRGAQPTAELAAGTFAMMAAQLHDRCARPSEGTVASRRWQGALASMAHLEVLPTQCDKVVPHILSAMSPAGAHLV